MEKHAMALGYFALAVFCIFTGSQQFLDPGLRFPLLLAAIVAALAGFGFLAGGYLRQLRAMKEWFVDLVNQLRAERDLPPRVSSITEDHST